MAAYKILLFASFAQCRRYHCSCRFVFHKQCMALNPGDAANRLAVGETHARGPISPEVELDTNVLGLVHPGTTW